GNGEDLYLQRLHVVSKGFRTASVLPQGYEPVSPPGRRDELEDQVHHHQKYQEEVKHLFTGEPVATWPGYGAHEHTVKAVQASVSKRPFRTGGLPHKGGHHQGHCQHGESHEDVIHATVEHDVAKQCREQR